MHSDDRTPPERIRITGLQEAQLPEIVQIDEACAAICAEHGIDLGPRRSEADFAKLTRDHDFYVAEADHVPAGFIAWRDESPGVAHIAELAVHPDFQRFGLGSRLLSRVLAEARAHKLRYVVVRTSTKAFWAMTFFRHHGFGPIEATSPAKVVGWRNERSAAGLAQGPGEVAFWTDVDTAALADDGIAETFDNDE